MLYWKDIFSDLNLENYNMMFPFRILQHYIFSTIYFSPALISSPSSQINKINTGQVNDKEWDQLVHYFSSFAVIRFGEVYFEGTMCILSKMRKKYIRIFEYNTSITHIFFICPKLCEMICVLYLSFVYIDIYVIRSI